MIKLPNELTIVQVDQCKSEVLQQIDENDVFEIDDSNVIRIDTVGIQLLLSIVTYIASQNKVLQWQSNSPVVKESIKQLGLNEAILNQYIDK